MNAVVWGKLAYQSNDLLCTFDGNGSIVHINSASESMLGFASAEGVGHLYAEFVHAKDRSITRQAARVLEKGETLTDFQNRLVHRKGHTVYVQWSATRSAEDGLVYAIGRDITALRLGRRRLEESEQRYRALFEHSKDLVFLENAEGVVTEVNQSFCDTFSVSKEKAQNARASVFLPTASSAEASLQAALAGSTIRGDLELKTETGDTKVYDAVKYPIKLKGEIIGVQTVARDITPMVRAYEASQRQAQKMNTILESITDGFLTVGRDWQITYINKEAERLLPFDRNYHIGVNLWELFPEEVDGEFYVNYQHAFATGETVSFTSQLKKYGKWLRVKAYPSDEVLSIYFYDVTEHVEVQREIEKLSLVASNTTNGVIIANSESRIEYVNEGFTTLTGYSFEEAIGHIPFELLRNERTNSETNRKAYENLLRGEPVSFEILNSRKNGSDIWLSIQLNPIVGEGGKVERYIAIQSDITERIKTQQELEKLSLVASKTNNSVLIADRDWRIEWVNDGFTRLYGYSLEEAVGKKPSELLYGPKTDKSKFTAQEGKLRGGEPISFELLNLAKSGEEVWVNIETSPVLDRHGNIMRYIEVQTDISALKTSELELAKLAEDLYRKNNDLQQFTYVVSHVLRQHGANIMGLLDMLMSTDKGSETYEHSMAFLCRSAYGLDGVLRDMNTILTIRENRGSLEMGPVDIREVLSEALSSLGERLQREDSVSIDIPAGLTARANRAYLYNVFRQLLSNAVKFQSAERRLEINVRYLGSPAERALLSVSDNGSGFNSAKEEKNLFKLYKRFHTQQEGRGIGLYLVRQQVEAMGGKIEVTSQEGKGTNFYLYLPLK